MVNAGNGRKQKINIIQAIDLPLSSLCCSSSVKNDVHDTSDWSSELWEHVWSVGTSVARVGCSDCIWSAFIFSWKRLSRVGRLSICAEVLRGSKIVMDGAGNVWIADGPHVAIFLTSSSEGLCFSGVKDCSFDWSALEPILLPYRDDIKNCRTLKQ